MHRFTSTDVNFQAENIQIDCFNMILRVIAECILRYNIHTIHICIYTERKKALTYGLVQGGLLPPAAIR